VVYLGSAIFKIARLTFIALFFVHLFACIFYRIKQTTAESPEDVIAFYSSKHVEENVSTITCFLAKIVDRGWRSLSFPNEQHIISNAFICVAGPSK
jgi:hypothetical protein